MPNLANTISPWSGANLNIKNLDVVNLEATDVSCTYLTVDGDSITPTQISDLETKTQNQSATSGTTNFSGDLTVDTNTLYVDGTNNMVGVNTATPTKSLDVVGTAKVSGNTEVGGTLTVTGDINVDSGVLKVDTTNNYIGINKSTPAYPLDVVGNTLITGDLAVNTDDLFVKTSNGFVGVNNSNPTYRLDVAGTMRVSDTATLNSVSISNTCQAKNLSINTNLIKTVDTSSCVGINKTVPVVAMDVVGAINATTDLAIATNVLKVTGASGYVGINKTTPANALDVVGTTNIYGALSCSNGSTTDVFGYNYLVGVLSQNSYFDCQNGTTSVLYVDHKVNSRVGIKNNNPQYELDVVGNAKVSGTFITGNTWTTYTPSTSSVSNCTVDGLSGRYINYGAYKQALISCQITYTTSGIGTVTLSLPSSFFTTVWNITQGAGYGLGYSGLLSVGGSSTSALSTTQVACSVLGGTTNYRVRIFLNVMGD